MRVIKEILGVSQASLIRVKSKKPHRKRVVIYYVTVDIKLYRLKLNHTSEPELLLSDRLGHTSPFFIHVDSNGKLAKMDKFGHNHLLGISDNDYCKCVKFKSYSVRIV